MAGVPFPGENYKFGGLLLWFWSILYFIWSLWEYLFQNYIFEGLLWTNFLRLTTCVVLGYFSLVFEVCGCELLPLQKICLHCKDELCDFSWKSLQNYTLNHKTTNNLWLHLWSSNKDIMEKDSLISSSNDLNFVVNLFQNLYQICNVALNWTKLHTDYIGGLSNFNN